MARGGGRRRALRARPDDDSIRLVLASALSRIGRLDEAARTLQAIPEGRRSSEVKLAQARLELLRGRKDDAAEYLDQALEENPTDPEILSFGVVLDQKRDSLDTSLQRTADAVAAEPGSAALLTVQAEALAANGQTAEAMEPLRRALEIDPNLLAANVLLARILSSESGPDAAVNRALEASIPPGPANAAVGSLYASRGDSQRAIRHFEAALDRDPNLVIAKNGLAFELAESGGDLDRALVLAREAWAADPSDPLAADTLGWVLCRRGEYEEAVGMLQRSLGGLPADSPHTPEVAYHLALAFEGMGEPAPAQRHVRQSLAAVKGREPTPHWATDAEELKSRLSAQRP